MELTTNDFLWWLHV